MNDAYRRERERLIKEGRMATGNLLDHPPLPLWMAGIGWALVAFVTFFVVLWL